ncbi:MAG: helix-turn-helix domain-containing protein [Minicystis sp.]
MIRARNGHLLRKTPPPPSGTELSGERREAGSTEDRASEGFLDPSDLVQVKYEMIRRHRVDGCSVTEVAAEFGVSRQTFYKIERAFETRGIMGLLPSKSGPRGGWKCTPELLDFLKRRRSERPGLEIADLRDEVEQRFQVRLHPNTVRYALAKAG